MPNPAWRKVFQQLRKSALLSDGAGLSDAQLLDCFLSDRDEDAFAALMRRHGPMVFGVCRRLLPSWQDAEDAYQATFLVLARKAAVIQPRRQVGNWLYGVAYRTALEARTILAKRRGKERPLQDVAQPEPADEPWRELKPILDSELSRLPDKYRIVIVCCDLQGKTRREAACQLGWPEGTVAARLARGRSLLRARLIRRGLTFSVASLASLLSRKSASACVSKALEVCTIKAATIGAAGASMATGLVSAQVAILTQGVLKSMFYTKLKFAAGLLIALGVLGFGTGVGMYAGGAQPTDAAPSIAAERPQADLAKGVKPPLQIPEVDQTRAVQEIEKQRTANVEEDGRESKKKVEKKKRHHEDDEDDDDDDREVKRASKKKREHKDDDEDDDHGRESKKKAGAKKREHKDDDEDDDRGREIKKKGSSKKREHDDDEDDDRGYKSKKKAGAKKREHEDDEDDEHEEMKKARKREHKDGEKKGRKTEKAGKKKREQEDDHRREHAKKSSTKKREHEDDAEHRELKKKSKKKRRRHEEGDDEHEGKKKAKKSKRHHEDDEDEHAREGKKKDKAKKRRHENDDDRNEHKKKAGKKKREHEADEDEDEGREGKKKRRHKDD